MCVVVVIPECPGRQHCFNREETLALLSLSTDRYDARPTKADEWSVGFCTSQRSVEMMIEDYFVTPSAVE